FQRHVQAVLGEEFFELRVGLRAFGDALGELIQCGLDLPAAVNESLVAQHCVAKPVVLPGKKMVAEQFRDEHETDDVKHPKLKLAHKSNRNAARSVPAMTTVQV